MRLRTVLLRTSAITFGVGIAAAAHAQQAVPTADNLVDEVVVTAQRRDERLQEVPVAVSAYTDRQRDLLGIITANDVAKFTPGMDFNLNRVIIRGIGRSSSVLGTDPGVATYYDGIYSDNAGSIGGAPISVARVEVLRGPQGTLYGRNSIGGAINIVSKRPTESFEGEFRQKLGNYETSETQLALSGPVSDRVRYRLELQRNIRNKGFVKNIAGKDRNNLDSWNGQAQVEVDVAENAQLWVQYANATWPNQRSLLGVGIDPYDTTSPRFNALIPNVLRGYTVANPAVQDHFKVSENNPGSFKLVNAPKFTVHFDWDLGNTKLKYIGGYYRAKSVFDYDFDGSARDGFVSPITGAFISANLRTDATSIFKAWSNELQWSSAGPGPLTWIVGAYQGHDDNSGAILISAPGQSDLDNVLSLATGTIARSNPRRAYITSSTRLKGDSYALYGQAEYEFVPHWTVTTGLRYTWDHKEGTASSRVIYFDPEGNGLLAPILGPTIGYAVELNNAAIAPSADFGGTTAKLGLKWEPNAETMAYASISRGYKAGGFNLGALSTAEVDPEYVNAFEIGLKARLMPNLQINTAIFYNDYKDIQVLGNVSGPGGVPTAALFNADKARTYGLEAETVWSPTKNLRFLLNYAYLDAEFTKFTDPVQDPNQPNGPDRAPRTGDEFQDLTGNTMQGAPRHKVLLNALYTLDFAAGSLSLSGTYAWTDKQYFSIFNTPTYLGKAHDEVDLRATWNDARGRYTIIGYAQNLFDEVYATNSALTPSNTGRVWQLAQPRTFGVEFQYHF